MNRFWEVGGIPGALVFSVEFQIHREVSGWLVSCLVAHRVCPPAGTSSVWKPGNQPEVTQQ